MSTCEHSWDRMHEEFLLGGHFPVGWQCSKCKKYVSNDQIDPSGLPGRISGRNVLVGPHGGKGRTSTGQVYIRQIVDADGKLTVET